LPVTNQGQLLGTESPNDNWNNRIFARKIYYDSELIEEDSVVTTYAARGNMYLEKAL
jgi:hypothetical protein